MMINTMQCLNLRSLRPTTTIVELVDKSRIKLEGVIEDLIVSLCSWEYLIDFFVLQPKSNLGRKSLILGIPWMATANAFISYRLGKMIISKGNESKQITLYPLLNRLMN